MDAEVEHQHCGLRVALISVLAATGALPQTNIMTQPGPSGVEDNSF